MTPTSPNDSQAAQATAIDLNNAYNAVRAAQDQRDQGLISAAELQAVEDEYRRIKQELEGNIPEMRKLRGLMFAEAWRRVAK